MDSYAFGPSNRSFPYHIIDCLLLSSHMTNTVHFSSPIFKGAHALSLCLQYLPPFSLLWTLLRSLSPFPLFTTGSALTLFSILPVR